MSEGRAGTVVGPLYGGSFSAHFDDDRSVFTAPYVLPGERIEAALHTSGSRREIASAALLRVLEPSIARVQPRCQHFGACGGCQYQHISTEQQIATKQDVLRGILEGARITAPTVQVHAAEPWEYRNRLRLRVRDGQIGYSRRSSNDFLPIVECPIASPLLWRAASAALLLMRSGEARWPGSLSEIELFADSGETALQVSLHLDESLAKVDRDAPMHFRRFCEGWQLRTPELRGGGLFAVGDSLPGQSKRIAESRRVEIAKWGEAKTRYQVGDHIYDVTRGAFFQVNRFLTERMVEIVCGQRFGDRVYDLFAGAGLFSVALASRFREVIAVEVGEPAATDLAANLGRRPGAHRAERRSTLEFLRAQRGAVPPDLVVMDPPRAGLGDAVAQELIRLNAREMVHVSCDPVTFARDAKTLLESGYRLIDLHLLDLFPQTFHIETIAVFSR